MGVKLGLSPSGNKVNCLAEYLVLRKGNYQDNGEIVRKTESKI